DIRDRNHKDFANGANERSNAHLRPSGGGYRHRSIERQRDTPVSSRRYPHHVVWVRGHVGLEVAGARAILTLHPEEEAVVVAGRLLVLDHDIEDGVELLAVRAIGTEEDHVLWSYRQ